MRFHDRTEAGRLLARALLKYQAQAVVVYALPRGGVVLGVEVAKHLQAPLDLVLPRKIGHSIDDEYAVGAVTETGDAVRNEREAATLDPRWLEEAIASARAEARRRRTLYLGSRPSVEAASKIAIIVDDGIATGLTMLAAIRELRRRSPARIVVAVPVMSAQIAPVLSGEADEIVSLHTPNIFLGGVGAYYANFEQVDDEEVMALLRPTRHF
jgi:putative phosphoribosyl transferase